jgi:membrane fusion protein, multidrug efflux system
MSQQEQPPPKEQSRHARNRPGTEESSREENGEEARRDEKQKTSDKESEKEQSHKPPPYKRPAVVIPAAMVLILGLVAGVLYWLHARHFESTDDAYVDGHVVQISPQIPAQVLTLHVRDNQFVHKGDLLIELDPTDYQLALEQAKAQAGSAEGKVEQARAQIGSAKAGVTQAAAEVDAAGVTLENDTREMERLQAVDERARSRQQLDNAIAAQRTAQAQVEQGKSKRISAESNVGTAEASVRAAEADLHTAEAAVHRAEVNLSYCRISSPCEGRVTQRTVEAGNYAQTGQAMFLLVEPDVWVTANFKETQLKHMRPGEQVAIKIDSMPGRKFAAHVDSIQSGSGSRFSVLPAENATGNFVKVVQRVPVKIVFDHLREEGAWGMAPGLSVVPKVRVR